MLRRRIWCLAALCSLLLAADATAQVSIVDDRGHTVTLEQPATRVVALYSGLSELVMALGETRALTARTSADHAPELAHLPSVGTHMRPSVERILAAKPQLVLQLAGRSNALLPVERLEELGVPVAVFRIPDFLALFSTWERIGALLGREETAKRLIQHQRHELAAIEAAVANKPRPTIFFEVRGQGLLSVGRDSLVTDIIRRAGGQNCVQESGKLVRVGDEALLAMNPDYYLIQQGPMNKNPLPANKRTPQVALKAVLEGRVHTVDEALFSRPGPRSVQAVKDLATLLHPDSFSGGRP